MMGIGLVGSAHVDVQGGGLSGRTIKKVVMTNNGDKLFGIFGITAGSLPDIPKISYDKGITWFNCNVPLSTYHVYDIGIGADGMVMVIMYDYREPNLLCYLSRDGGVSWAAVPKTQKVLTGFCHVSPAGGYILINDFFFGLPYRNGETGVIRGSNYTVDDVAENQPATSSGLQLFAISDDPTRFVCTSSSGFSQRFTGSLNAPANGITYSISPYYETYQKLTLSADGEKLACLSSGNIPESIFVRGSWIDGWDSASWQPTSFPDYPSNFWMDTSGAKLLAKYGAPPYTYRHSSDFGATNTIVPLPSLTYEHVTAFAPDGDSFVYIKSDCSISTWVNLI